MGDERDRQSGFADGRSGWVGCSGRGTGGLARRSEGVKVREGGSNSVVESQPSKLLVAGSIPVSRSSLRSAVREARAELLLAGRFVWVDE